MDFAFYFYDLTDVIPNKVYLATPNNYRTIKNEKIVQIFSDKNLLNAGKESITKRGFLNEFRRINFGVYKYRL